MSHINSMSLAGSPRAGIPLKEGLRPAVDYRSNFFLLVRVGIPVKEGLSRGFDAVKVCHFVCPRGYSIKRRIKALVGKEIY